MKAYYNNQIISSSFKNFFKNLFSISKPILNNFVIIITSMISSESVVTADIARKTFSPFPVYLESLERRFRRFFASFSSVAYSCYSSFISYIISKYTVKHSDQKVYISFDHMYCKDKFIILLFSLRIGKQGIPLWFRCFKKHSPNSSDAFKTDLLKQGISFCTNLFSQKNYHIIFLADRWFSIPDILSYIESIGCFYCIRSKGYFMFSYHDSQGNLISKHVRDIAPLKDRGKVLKNVLYTRKQIKTNIVVSNCSNSSEPWFLVTNDNASRAIRNYSYRFGSIECIFKSQKSNGFRLEATNTQKLKHFISLFTVMCFALVWLTIIGVDYAKNKHHYHLKIRDIRRFSDNTTSRLYSFFNLGLTIFNICFFNEVDFRLKFNFILYDI